MIVENTVAVSDSNEAQSPLYSQRLTLLHRLLPNLFLQADSELSNFTKPVNVGAKMALLTDQLCFASDWKYTLSEKSLQHIATFHVHVDEYTAVKLKSETKTREIDLSLVTKLSPEL